MKFKHLGALSVALLATAALTLSPVVATAAGIWTNGATNITAAQITGSETLPLDTNYANGASPQSAAVTLAAQKTYSNGGAIVAVTGASAAATANGERVVITTEALTTAAAAIFTETLTNSSIVATSVVLCSVGQGTNTTDGPTVMTITPAAGSVVIKVKNTHASAALNGTLTIACRASS